GDLRVPHPAGGAIAVAQQDGGAVPVILVIDLDAAAIEKGHAQSPYWARTKGGAASRGAATRRSAQGREGSRDDQHILLLDHHAWPAPGRRRPDALGARL